MTKWGGGCKKGSRRKSVSGQRWRLRRRGIPRPPPFPRRDPGRSSRVELDQGAAPAGGVLDLPLDPVDPRVGRLIAEVANQTVNAVVRAQEKSLAAKRDDEHDRAMEALFEERMKKAQLEIDRLNAAGPSPFSYKPGLSGHRFSKG